MKLDSVNNAVRVMQEKIMRATRDLTLDDLDFIVESLQRCAAIDDAAGRRHMFGLDADKEKSRRCHIDRDRANLLADQITKGLKHGDPEATAQQTVETDSRGAG